MKIERDDALVERSKVTMNKLRMMIAVFFLTLALSAFVGAGPSAATRPDTEVEAGSARRALDADFLRHNVGFRLYTSNTESIPRRGMHDVDFLRHNYGIDPWDVDVDARKTLQTQGDQDRIEYRRNKR
jgi:hypothetical protein